MKKLPIILANVIFCDRINVRYTEYAKCVIFTMVKMHTPFYILGGKSEMCRSNRSYAFFVRGFGRALFSF